MRTIRNTFTIVAARGSPESTGRGEISRAEVVAEAEAAPLTIDTPELRRLSVENAWRFDADTLEIECWGRWPGPVVLLHGSSSGRPAQRTGPSVLGRDVPGAGPRRVRLRGRVPGYPAGQPTERTASRRHAPNLRERV